MKTDVEKHTYLGVTIGPIYRTLADARKVRHLWGASFLFSQLMKEIIAQVDDPAVGQPFFKRLLPRYQPDATDPTGVGLFPDRLFLRVKEGKETAATNALNMCLQNAVNALGGDINKALDKYLQTYAVKAEIAEGENYVLALNHLLDGLELAQRAGGEVTFELGSYLDGILPIFYGTAFNEQKKFETVTEISAKDLAPVVADYDKFIEDYRRRIGQENEPDFFKKLMEWVAEEGAHEPQKKALLGKLKQYHKYVAIVHADGDNIGKVLSQIGKDDQLLETFSQHLFAFAKAAARKIDDWGAMPIYAGGDDLLFLAPVCVGQETIFQLTADLARIFDQEVTQNLGLSLAEPPTLSFGINIIYHKFPLSEGVQESHRQLVEVAKKTTGKNCTAFRIQKHSGRDIEGIVRHGAKKEAADVGQTLLAQIPTLDDEKLFSSVIYTLQTFEHLLVPIVKDANRLEYFFHNHFNESIHRQEPAKQRIASIRQLLHATALRHEKPEQALHSVYAMLRFIQFIQADFQA